MTNVKKRRIPVVTVLLFAIAISLLLFSSVGGARAALTYGTAASAYEVDIGMMSASIGLYENGSAVSGTLLADFGESDGTVIPGKAYPEELYVVNSSISNVQNGQVDEYIRVVIYSYWLDENDKKAPELDASFIEPHLLGGNWIEDTAESTAERTVLYYSKPVAPGSATAPFMDTLMVEENVLYTVTQTGTGTSKTLTTFFYDGKQVCLEVEADAVQTHHGEDAILSAWGRSVSIASDGTLSLN